MGQNDRMTGIVSIFDWQKKFFEILKNWELESDYKSKFISFSVPISKNFFFPSSLTKGQSKLERLYLADECGNLPCSTLL